MKPISQKVISSPLLKRAEELDFKKDEHYVNILDRGDDALLVRIHLIRAAKKSIYIQTFIWRDDEVGLKVLAELYEAAQRGVRVKILVDNWVINKEQSILQHMNFKHKNFEILIYNPSANKLELSTLEVIQKAIVDFHRINQRMHNKTFIVDESIAIVGGRNYDNMYYDRGKKTTFIDLDLMVTGKVVCDVLESFHQYWDCGMSIRPFDFKEIDEENFEICRQRLQKSLTEVQKDTFDELNLNADTYTCIEKKFNIASYVTDKIRFVYDQPEVSFQGKERERSGVLKDLRHLMFHAKHSLLVQSPYFVLSNHAADGFRELRKTRRHIDIVVSTNSLAATDNLYAYAFLNKEKRLYVKDFKIKIFEMKPKPADMDLLVNNDVWKMSAEEKKRNLCLHAKIFIIDDVISWVGTFNVDIRSEYYNTEIAFIIEDEAITKVIKERIVKMLEPENSWVVAPKKYIPVITEFNDWMTMFSRMLPVIDLWPFRNMTCYELIQGKKRVSVFHPDFYDHYREVGLFPQVAGKLKDKKLMINLIQMFGQIIKPIV